MGMSTLKQECRGYRELMQQAQEILVQEQSFSTDEAHRYLYELAQAGKLFISEIAGRIVTGEWVWTEASQELISTDAASADAARWLGCW